MSKYSLRDTNLKGDSFMKHSKLLLLPLLALTLTSCGPKEVDRDTFIAQVETNTAREGQPSYKSGKIEASFKELEKSGDKDLFDGFDLEDLLGDVANRDLTEDEIEREKITKESAESLSEVSPLVTDSELKYYVYSDGGVAFEITSTFTVPEIPLLSKGTTVKSTGTQEFDKYNYPTKTQGVFTITLKQGDKNAKGVFEVKGSYIYNK